MSEPNLHEEEKTGEATEEKEEVEKESGDEDGSSSSGSSSSLSIILEPEVVPEVVEEPPEPEEEAEDEPEWGACAGKPPTSTVEITISCKSLVNKDTFSKSDPMCVVFHKPNGTQGEWAEYMRTETIENDLNPNFMEKLTIEYRFEERQQLRFIVYDVDKADEDLENHEFLGSMECTLGNIVSAGPSGYSKPLTLKGKKEKEGAKEVKKPGDADKPLGSIILTAEELQSLKDEITFKFDGQSIGSMGCFCFPPKVFYVFSRSNEAMKYLVVHRSEQLPGVNPEWKAVTVPVRRVCNGDKDLKLKIEAFQVMSNFKNKSLGFCLTTVNKLVSLGTGGIPLQLHSGKPTSATILVMQCKIQQIFTFVDYIQSGTQIHCCVSIDFTSSNGDPREKHSLHYFAPEEPNPYVQAIESVVGIIQDYDDDKLFPVYGFGAKIPPNRAVSHNFFVTLTNNGYCQEIEGILEGYKSCIGKIELYGPTNFSPVIQHVSDMAQKNDKGDHYFILLIITDGVITDIAQTKEAIVNASDFPVSIIIVGVGGEDFDEMEELDGDKVRLSHRGKVAVRDIVQFVAYRDSVTWLAAMTGTKKQARKPPTMSYAEAQALANQFFNQQNPGTDRLCQLAQEKLAQEILAEIPDQLTGYMRSKEILPSNIVPTQFIEAINPNEDEEEKPPEGEETPAPAP